MEGGRPEGEAVGAGRARGPSRRKATWGSRVQDGGGSLRPTTGVRLESCLPLPGSGGPFPTVGAEGMSSARGSCGHLLLGRQRVGRPGVWGWEGKLWGRKPDLKHRGLAFPRQPCSPPQTTNAGTMAPGHPPRAAQPGSPSIFSFGHAEGAAAENAKIRAQGEKAAPSTVSELWGALKTVRCSTAGD